MQAPVARDAAASSSQPASSAESSSAQGHALSSSCGPPPGAIMIDDHCWFVFDGDGDHSADNNGDTTLPLHKAPQDRHTTGASSVCVRRFKLDVYAKRFMFPVHYCEHATVAELYMSVALFLREATHAITLFHGQAPLPRHGQLNLWCHQAGDHVVCQSAHALTPPQCSCHDPIVLDPIELACERTDMEVEQPDLDMDGALLADQERIAMADHDHNVCLVTCRNLRSDVLIQVRAGTTTEDLHIRYAKTKKVRKDRIVPYVRLDEERQITTDCPMVFIQGPQVRGGSPIFCHHAGDWQEYDVPDDMQVSQFLDMIGCNDQFLIYADATLSPVITLASLQLDLFWVSQTPFGVLLRDRADVVRSTWISLAELKEWCTSPVDDGMDTLAGPSDAFQVPLGGELSAAGMDLVPDVEVGKLVVAGFPGSPPGQRRLSSLILTSRSRTRRFRSSSRTRYALVLKELFFSSLTPGSK